MSIETLRRELADLPMARILAKHQTFARKAGLSNLTVRYMRDFRRFPEYTPSITTVQRWLTGAESDLDLRELLTRHGLAMEDLDKRSGAKPVARRPMQPAVQPEQQKPSGQQVASSFMVSPSRLGGDHDAESIAALRTQIAHALHDLAALYTDLASKFDAHITSEPAEAPARAASHRDTDHPQARRVR